MNKIFSIMPLCLVLAFLILSPGQNAQAYGSYHSYSSSSFSDGSNGFLLQVDGIYYFTTEGGNPPNNANTTITRQLIDGLFGYHFDLFFLGANYTYDAIVTSSNNPTSTDAFRGYGADIGLMTDNLFLFFTYYFNGNGTTGAGSTTERDFNNGSGYQVTLGYQFDVGSGFSVGPSIAYKSITYNNFSSGASTSFTYTTLVPEASIRYKF